MERIGCSLVEKQGKSLETLEMLLLLFCGANVRKKPSTSSYTTKTVESPWALRPSFSFLKKKKKARE